MSLQYHHLRARQVYPLAAFAVVVLHADVEVAVEVGAVAVRVPPENKTVSNSEKMSNQPAAL